MTTAASTKPRGVYTPIPARLLKQGDMSQNIYLQPDDFVYLPAATAREVYVLGAVAQPRAVVWNEGLTVAGAVAIVPSQTTVRLASKGESVTLSAKLLDKKTQRPMQKGTVLWKSAAPLIAIRPFSST